MASNTFRLPGKKQKGGSFFEVMDRILRIDESIRDVIHVRFLPQIIFLTFLAVIYIGNRHYAEKKIRNISILEQEVEDLRADYTTLKADYMFASKQSEVAKKASELGLYEPKNPPQKVIINE
jgi:cell division protein FtsL